MFTKLSDVVGPGVGKSHEIINGQATVVGEKYDSLYLSTK